MTIQRQGAHVRRVRDIAVSSTLSLALLTGAPLLQSCGGDSSDTPYETRQETTFSRGVKTYITEVEPGVFKVTDEIPTAADSSVAIVRYHDGHRDTLNTASAKALIDNEINTRPATLGHSNSLGNALLYGGMGYLLANTLQNRQYAAYRDRFYREEENRRGSSGGFYGGRYYANPETYRRSQVVGREISASRSVRTVTTSRPAGGRSGFFGGRGFRGFGG
jgi:hypothetical protein